MSSPGRWGELVAGLFPGYFAMVMSTGIVAIAAMRLEYHAISTALFWVSVLAYGVLGAMTLLRLALYPARVVADLVDHGRGPGFFTLVAATCLVGIQLLLRETLPSAASALWSLGFLVWLVVGYGFFGAAAIKSEKPPIETGLNGAWLLAVVSTQSLSILGTLLAARGVCGHPLLFVSLCMFLLGAMMYLWISGMIVYRLLFLKIGAQALTPPYWISMGAAAITTLAGSNLALHLQAAPFLAELGPFIKGMTVLYWATCTWWIPLLLILGVWRHGRMGVPLGYDPQYWAMVFPLGMYAACTLQFSRAIGVEFVAPVARWAFIPALAAWAVVFLGMLGRLAGGPKEHAA